MQGGQAGVAEARPHCWNQSSIRGGNTATVTTLALLSPHPHHSGPCDLRGLFTLETRPHSPEPDLLPSGCGSCWMSSRKWGAGVGSCTQALRAASQRPGGLHPRTSTAARTTWTWAGGGGEEARKAQGRGAWTSGLGEGCRGEPQAPIVPGRERRQEAAGPAQAQGRRSGARDGRLPETRTTQLDPGALAPRSPVGPEGGQYASPP